MENFFKKLLVAFILITATNLNAAYLKDVPQTITQPDGTTLECFSTGDEFYSRLHDAEGYTIIQNPQTGIYVYANKIGNELVPTNLVFGQHNPQSLELEKGLSISHSSYMERRRPFDEAHQVWFEERESQLKKQGDQFQVQQKTINNIVIFVEFPDKKFTKTNLTQYQTNYNTGSLSMKAYFNEVSYGNCTINSHFFPVSNNNLIMRYTVQNNRGYYEPYNAQTNPIGYTSVSQGDQRTKAVIAEAINGIKSQIPTTLQLDAINFGYVDAITVVFQGSPVYSDGSVF
jgi:hypothetical protein